MDHGAISPSLMVLFGSFDAGLPLQLEHLLIKRKMKGDSNREDSITNTKFCRHLVLTQLEKLFCDLKVRVYPQLIKFVE